eukprot:jgi/Tetstr1/454235/TSEL_041154.t1
MIAPVLRGAPLRVTAGISERGERDRFQRLAKTFGEAAAQERAYVKSQVQRAKRRNARIQHVIKRAVEDVKAEWRGRPVPDEDEHGHGHERDAATEAEPPEGK